MSDTPASDTPGNAAPAWDDRHRTMLTFIGSVCSQLLELAQSVEDEALKAKLLNLADQCVGEFFEGLFVECASQPPEIEQG